MKQAFTKILQRAVQKDASDIHMKVGSPPYYRVDGDMQAQQGENVSNEMMEEILHILLNEAQYKYFMKRGDIDLAYNEKGVGRFE